MAYLNQLRKNQSKQNLNNLIRAAEERKVIENGTYPRLASYSTNAMTNNLPPLKRSNALTPLSTRGKKRIGYSSAQPGEGSKLNQIIHNIGGVHRRTKHKARKGRKYHTRRK